MACQIKRNPSNKVVEVLVETLQPFNDEKNTDIGDNNSTVSVMKPSILFNKLAGIPFLDTNQAMDSYKNIYAKKFTDSFGAWETEVKDDSNPLTYDTNEPKLFFKTPQGTLTTEYGSALKNTTTGNIEVGFLATEDVLSTKDRSLFEVAKNDVVEHKGEYVLNNGYSFTKVLEIDSASDPSTYNGYINKSIRDGRLSDTKVQVGEDYFFKGAGELESLSVYNSQLVKQDAISKLGRESVKTYPDGTLELIQIDKDKIELPSEKGGQTLSRKDLKEQLKTGKFPKLNKVYDGFLRTAYTLFREDNSLYGKTRTNEEVEGTSNKDLRISLLNTLNSLGIKTMSISNYISNYGTKNNVDPSVEALADIANNVIAFAEGKNTTENMTEETAHFIIEGYEDQASISEVLPLVEETIEWKEHSARYYDKYSDTYTGEELDNAVRREILGKILKSKIIDNFNSQNKNTSEVQIISTLREVFNKFVTKLRSYFTPNLTTDLNKVLDTLAERTVNEEITEYIDPNLIKNSKFILFSLDNKREIVTLQKARQRLERRLNALKQSKDVTAPTVQNDINNLSAAIERNDEWGAIKVITSSLFPQVRSIKKQLATYKELNKKDNGEVAYFTPEEQNAYNSLSEDFLPILGELRVVAEKDLTPIEEVNKDNLLKQIDTLISDIVQLKGEKDLQVKADNNSIASRIISQYNLSENERAHLERLIEQELLETSWFQRKFGSLEHSTNPFLGMLGKIINENNTRANNATLRDINPFLKNIDEGNWDIKRLRTLLELNDGELTNYTKSPYKWGKFIEAELSAQVEAYNLTMGTTLTVEQYKQGLKDRKLKKKSEYTKEQTKVHGDFMTKWYEENTERRYTQEFYDKRKKLYEDVSQNTQDFLQALSVRRYSIMSKYISPTSELDYTNMNSRDLQQLDILAQERKAAKSTIDAETGLEKSGTQLQLALELKKLDDKHQENKTEFKIKDSFYETLDTIEKEQGSSAAFKWLTANGGILFNDNFWGKFGEDRVSLVQKLEIVKNEAREESLEDYERIGEIQTKLETLLKRKTEILKQYQVPNNPSEMNYDIMSGQVLENVKRIEADLQQAFKEVNQIITSRYDAEEITDPIAVENTTNLAYDAALKDSSKSELEFILDHVTDADKERIINVKRVIEEIKRGSTNMDSSVRRFLEGYLKVEELDLDTLQDSLQGVSTEELVNEYGKTRVLPYFKRFAPQGYDVFLNKLRNGNRSVVEFVNQVRNRNGGELTGDVSDMLSVNTQFSWTEDEAGSSLLNPNYDDQFEGGYRQPKLDEYLNEEFFNEFGVSKEEYKRTKQLVPTRNLDSYNMLEQLWDIKRKGLDAYNETGSNNIYKIPQVSKGTVERFKDFVGNNPTQTVSNSIKDLVYNRVDELGYGERLEGEDVRDISDVRLIPKYYLRDLEEASDVSTELAHSYSQFLQSAYVYQERLNTVSDAMVLQQTLLEGADAANLDDVKSGYNMFKDFMDANFFGITRTKKFKLTLPNGKELDLSKLAMSFDNFVRYMNIGFSLPIAATSLVSAELFLRLENFVGEHVNTNSAKWATKEFAKISKEFVSEIGSINKESRMNMLAEKFRVYDIGDRTTSSGFNKIIRASNHLPYKFSEIANFPIAPRIMLTVLDDFRLIGDTFTDFNTFKQRSDNQGISKKKMEEKWNMHRENSMYNLLENQGGQIEFTQAIREKFDNDFLEQQLIRVQGRISRVNANVDSVVPQEDKSAATRDFLMNFMTAHRGWLSIAIQRKFKRQHFNFITGQREEGHYRTLARYIKDSFGLMEEKNMKNFVKVFKENFNQLDDFEKRNIKRILTELGVYMFMLGFGIIVAGIADDDDNKDNWALQFASYIYFRTVSEVGSVQAPTGVFGLVDTVQAPFIAINSIKTIMDVKGFSFDEVNAGAYEGHTKLYKKLVKQTWLRHWYDLKGVKQKSDFYRVLNAETLFHLSK